MNTHNDGALRKILGVETSRTSVRVLAATIEYLKAGSGEPLLLIHGGSIGWGQWYRNIKHFSKKFTVYAIDLPGCGQSSQVDFNNTDLVRDFVVPVEQFLQSVEPTSPAHCVGASFGGWICQELALRKKVLTEKIVLVDSLGFSIPNRFRDRILAIHPLVWLLTHTVLRVTPRNKKKVESFMRSVFYRRDFVLEPEFIGYFFFAMQRVHMLAFMRALVIYFKKHKTDIPASLAEISNKTLIVWGRHDPLLPISQNQPMFKRIPRGMSYIFENSGHMPPIEEHELFNEVVENFLLY